MGFKKIRVLMAKPGLDGHDRGVKIISRALTDAGMEVVYGGRRQTPEQIVKTAIQEDVDIIGLSCLSGAHLTLFKAVMDLLKAENSEDIIVMGGGIIPDQDVPVLEQAGIRRVFGPGTTTGEIVEFIERAVPTDQPNCQE